MVGADLSVIGGLEGVAVTSRLALIAGTSSCHMAVSVGRACLFICLFVCLFVFRVQSIPYLCLECGAPISLPWSQDSF